MLLCTIAGIIYFLLSRYVKGGNVIYIVLFCALTVISIIAGMNVQRSSDPHVTAAFRGLLMGTVIITGLLATFAIPYLSRHDTLYND